MKIKTAELTGKALAYAAACAENMSFPSLKHCEYPDDHAWVLHPDGTIRSAQEMPSSAMSRQYDYTFWMPQEDWAQGGPIIERERISTGWIIPAHQHRHLVGCRSAHIPGGDGKMFYGPTALISAMRCFVASKLGDEVDVPQELMA